MEPTDPILATANRFGYVENGGIWRRAALGQPAQRIGQVKESADDALRYFARRFTDFQAKVEEVIRQLTDDDHENPGSFLLKAQHLKEQTLTFAALGDFEDLHQRLQEAEAGQQAVVADNRKRNLATKIGFIRDAEDLASSLEWVGSSEKVKELRQAWLTTGPVSAEHADELEARFQAAIKTFFDRRKAFQHDKKAMAARVQNRYRDLIDQAEALRESTDFENASRQLKQLQKEWREVNGTIPKKLGSELWTRFRAANNYFFERLKNHIEAQRMGPGGRPATPEELLARKRTLAERAEALMNVPPQQAIIQAKLLQTDWKQVGTVRGEESDRLWQRFMVACDKVFEMSGLEYHLRHREEGPGPGPEEPEERARFRAGILRELLEDDRKELQTLRDNLAKLGPSPSNDSSRNMLETKIRSFDRKVRTKTDLIALFEQQAQ